MEWPAAAFKDDGSPLVIGVSGSDAMLAELRNVVRGREVQNCRLTAVSVQSDTESAAVHVLYVGRESAGRLARVARSGRSAPVLLVADFPDGLDHGAVINFVTVERKVRFEISIESAERSGLAISSRLLGVAVRIKRSRSEPFTLLSRAARSSEKRA